jgi:WD40 repeat protein
MKPLRDDDTLPTQPAAPSAELLPMPMESLPTAAGAAGLDKDPFDPTHRDPRQRYHVLGEHGRGGLGRVSRAHDCVLHRDVAIKELLARTSVNELRFMREALITARLEHPGIVPVHEAGRWDDGTPFYAMKLVSGRPLRDLIAERTTVDARIGLLHHVIAVADAIAYAHGCNIIHRDLKPANIIVGDFGETVVIDWGLAKDLNTTDDAPFASGPLGRKGNDELTTAGSVLGTPAYMAPEQARGEHVDQRADVFAIGAMLWELCSVQRVPPAEERQRHRMLRRAGLDQDLAAIIDKALAPDPKHRYPDAGALASDLRAFKSGARIAARNYSLPGLLAHWIRRHRALTVSLTAAVALAVTGVAFYIRDIASERDRADAARVEAEAQRREAETGRSELILQHSELLMHSDPTAAVAALATYHGVDDVRRRLLLAEALGRGVARAVLSPHSDTIWFLVGEANGAFISLGEDHRIRRTQGVQSTTLAQDVAINVLFDYSPATRSLAYMTSPPGVSVLDLATLSTTHLATITLVAMTMAPDGSSLATLDLHGELTVWSLPSGLPSWRESLPDAVDIKLITATRLLVTQRAALQVISLNEVNRSSLATTSPVYSLDTRKDHLIIGDEAGNATLLSLDLKIISNISLCHKRINSVRFIGQTNLATYACQDGIAGVVRFDVTVHSMADFDVFSTQGPALTTTPDPSGHWIVVRSDSNITYVYDTVTRLVQQYEGQSARISSAKPPSPGYNNILVGDVNGTVRVWPLPSEASRKILESPRAIFDLSFSPDSTELAAGGVDGIVRRVNITSGTISELHGQTSMATRVAISPDAKSIMSFGSDQSVHVWRTSDGAALRTFTNHAAEIGDADYIEKGRRIVSAGADGRLLAWPTTGTDEILLFKDPNPLVDLEVLDYNNHVVVENSLGAVWDIAAPGIAHLVRRQDSAVITLLRASIDGRLVAIGTDQGSVTIYHSSDWSVLLTIKVGGGIRQVAFDPYSRDLAIASEDGHVRIVALATARTLPWHDVVSSAREIVYTSDGETLAFVCSDGGAWFYSMHDDTWVYTRDHSTDTTSGAFSPDGKWFASSDRRGMITLRNIVTTLSKTPSRINSKPTGSK